MSDRADLSQLILKLASALEHVLQFAPAVKRREDQYWYFLTLMDKARLTAKTIKEKS